MIRVLLTLSSGRVGGAEQHVLWLASAMLRTRGFRAEVACREGEIARRLRSAGVKVHTMAFSDGLDWITPLRLGSLARDFDLLHAHMNRASLYTRFAAWMSGRPWVTTAHGMTRGIYSMGAERVIGVSQAVRAHLEAQGVGPVTVVPNGLPQPEPAAPAARTELIESAGLEELPEDRVLMLVLANLHRNKGQDLAVRALERLPERFHLLLAGAGEFPEMERLLDEDTALRARVHRVGILDSPAAPFELSDLVLVPSIRESFSLVAAEARMRGVPVVAADVDGLKEVVEDGAPGCLRVPGRDPEVWAAALRDAGEGLVRLRERARRAAPAARRRFALPACVQTTLTLYAAALNDHPG